MYSPLRDARKAVMKEQLIATTVLASSGFELPPLPLEDLYASPLPGRRSDNVVVRDKDHGYVCTMLISQWRELVCIIDKRRRAAEAQSDRVSLPIR
jgi:hypothetical protein